MTIKTGKRYTSPSGIITVREVAGDTVLGWLESEQCLIKVKAGSLKEVPEEVLRSRDDYDKAVIKLTSEYKGTEKDTKMIRAITDYIRWVLYES